MKKHVYFYSLPMGAEFTHKGNEYRKDGDESVYDIKADKSWVFEGHYGCIVPLDQYPEAEIRE